ncbi:MAG TPA: hypothetical protein VFA66_15990 [Gaiellaceae bacterium]|nr:hypothetical protein [Gaiellaceae bacterium]
MRRLALIIGVVALTLPGVAGALRAGPGDGTLAVDNAKGSIQLRVKGGIIGRFDQGGTIDVYDPIAGDGAAPVIKGCEFKEQVGPRHWECSSSQAEVRFRLIGGLYKVTIEANGIDLSIVGRGSAVLDGSGFDDQTGRYSVNGGSYQPFPHISTKLSVSTPAQATVGSK